MRIGSEVIGTERYRTNIRNVEWECDGSLRSVVTFYYAAWLAAPLTDFAFRNVATVSAFPTRYRVSRRFLTVTLIYDR